MRWLGTGWRDLRQSKELGDIDPFAIGIFNIDMNVRGALHNGGPTHEAQLFPGPKCRTAFE